MAEPDWLHTGPRSGRPIMTAPGGASARDAVERVDAALDGWSGPVPGWYRAVGRIGYWWILLCLGGGLAIGLVAGPDTMAWKIASGLMIGIVAIPVGGVLLRLLARAQSKASGAGTPDAALAQVAAQARPMSGDVKRAVDAVLFADPRQGAQLHRLAWRSNEDESVLRQIDDLWRQADPEAVAARDAETARLEARVEEVRRQAQERNRQQGR